MFSHRVHPVRITRAVEERLVLAREDRETTSWHLQWYRFMRHQKSNKDKSQLVYVRKCTELICIRV